MHRTTPPPETTATTPRRPSRLVLLGLALVLALSTLAGLPSSSEARGRTTATKGAGYSERAFPGFIGRYDVRGKAVYRIGWRHPVAGGRYGQGRYTKSGPRRSRAAWILSTYGGRGGKEQAAAVDAAVLWLVSRKQRLGVDGRDGNVRIRQTGADARYVRGYALQMLRESNRLAGPYRTSLRTSGPSQEGSGTTLTFTIRSRTGHGLLGIPVSFSYAGKTITGVTNDKGVATTTVTAEGGEPTATARANGVPDWQLFVRTAPRRHAVVAEAGRRRSILRGATVVSAQDVQIENAKSRVRTGSPLAGTYTINGGSGERTVRIEVYGPTTSSGVECTGAHSTPWDATVGETPFTGNLPAFEPTKSGYYRWKVVAGANESSTEASECGPFVQVQSLAQLSQVRPSAIPATVKVGQRIGVDVKVTGFDRSEGHQLTARLYGPFATRSAVSCTPARQVKTTNKIVAANGTYTMPRLAAPSVPEGGRYYAWSSVVTSGNFIEGNSSGCGVIVKVTR